MRMFMFVVALLAALPAVGAETEDQVYSREKDEAFRAEAGSYNIAVFGITPDSTKPLVDGVDLNEQGREIIALNQSVAQQAGMVVPGVLVMPLSVVLTRAKEHNVDPTACAGDEICLVQIAGQVGANYAISGTVSKHDGLLIDLRLYRVAEHGKMVMNAHDLQEGGARVEGQSFAELRQHMAAGMRELLNPIFVRLDNNATSVANQQREERLSQIPKRKFRRILGLSMMGLGLIGGGITAGGALTLKSKQDSIKSGQLSTPDEVVKASNSIAKGAPVVMGVGIASGALLVTGLVLYIASPPPAIEVEHDQAPQQPSTSTTISVTPFGLVAQGSF